MTWANLYTQVTANPNIQILPEHIQRRLFMLISLQQLYGIENMPEAKRESQILMSLHITAVELRATKDILIELGVIDEDWLIQGNRRKRPSDHSTDRVRRYRERQKAAREAHPAAFHSVSSTVSPGVSDSVSPPFHENEEQQQKQQKQQESKLNNTKQTNTAASAASVASEEHAVQTVTECVSPCVSSGVSSPVSVSVSLDAWPATEECIQRISPGADNASQIIALAVAAEPEIQDTDLSALLLELRQKTPQQRNSALFLSTLPPALRGRAREKARREAEEDYSSTNSWHRDDEHLPERIAQMELCLSEMPNAASAPGLRKRLEELRELQRHREQAKKPPGSQGPASSKAKARDGS